jgi:hypothetical protein
MLLVQPAVSRWALSQAVESELGPLDNTPGEFLGIADLVRQPVVLTFSVTDPVLTKIYPADLPQGRQSASDTGGARALFAALGAYGPDDGKIASSTLVNNFL